MVDQALEAIVGLKNNKIVMDFVTNEARKQVAAEIRTKTGSGTTAKAVELLSYKHQSIQDRVSDYINAGLIGCYMAGQVAA